MREFEYYRTNPVAYPNRSAKLQELRDEINSALLTARDRELKLEQINDLVQIWFRDAVKPHNNAEQALLQEFWSDCRTDIGYDKFLTDEGVAALEAAAWERGHASGFSEIYNELCDLADLAKKLICKK